MSTISALPPEIIDLILDQLNIDDMLRLNYASISRAFYFPVQKRRFNAINLSLRLTGTYTDIVPVTNLKSILTTHPALGTCIRHLEIVLSPAPPCATERFCCLLLMLTGLRTLRVRGSLQHKTIWDAPPLCSTLPTILRLPTLSTVSFAMWPRCPRNILTSCVGVHELSLHEFVIVNTDSSIGRVELGIKQLNIHVAESVNTVRSLYGALVHPTSCIQFVRLHILHIHGIRDKIIMQDSYNLIWFLSKGGSLRTLSLSLVNCKYSIRWVKAFCTAIPPVLFESLENLEFQISTSSSFGGAMQALDVIFAPATRLRDSRSKVKLLIRSVDRPVGWNWRARELEEQQCDPLKRMPLLVQRGNASVWNGEMVVYQG